MVSTQDFDSCDPGSTPGRASFLQKYQKKMQSGGCGGCENAVIVGRCGCCGVCPQFLWCSLDSSWPFAKNALIFFILSTITPRLQVFQSVFIQPIQQDKSLKIEAPVEVNSHITNSQGPFSIYLHDGIWPQWTFKAVHRGSDFLISEGLFDVSSISLV